MKFHRVLQSVWDWRAAGNFMFGGTGAGLLAIVAATSFPNQPSMAISLIALASVATGLFLVWLEIGRTWRFFNVLFHPQTSWMSREAFVAALVFALTLAGVVFQIPVLITLGGVAALAFLYCQARMLKAAKGIPAWRDPAIVPLITITGVTEGTGALVACNALFEVSPQPLIFVLFALLIFRFLSWRNYRKCLVKNNAPEGSIAALTGIHPLILSIGTVLPVLLIASIAIFDGQTSLLAGIAGLCAVGAGWIMKFQIVTRAAHYQGYELKIGRPASVRGVAPGN